MFWRLPRWCSGKEPTCQCRRHRRPGFNPWVGKILRGRKWQPTPVFLPRKSHGQRSLAGYSPWGHRELDTTERTHTPLYFQEDFVISQFTNDPGSLILLQDELVMMLSETVMLLVEIKVVLGSTAWGHLGGHLGTPLVTSVWKWLCLWVVFGDLNFIRRWQLTSGLAGCKSIGSCYYYYSSLQPRIII